MKNDLDKIAREEAEKEIPNGTYNEDCYREDISEIARDGYAEGFISGYNYPKWVSVEDALPENNERVLCYNGCRMLENSYCEHTGQDKKWFIKSFTHWQPLPPEPTK